MHDQELFKRHGLWSAQHEARADLTMLLGWPVDALVDERHSRKAAQQA